jgi:hypothetical protein
MNGFVLLSLALALSNSLDIFTDIVAIVKGGASPVQIGVYNALSYVVFIAGLFFGGRLGDRGVIRLQTILFAVALVGYSVSLQLFTQSRLLNALIVMYVTYPLAQAFATTSLTAYIHEHYPSYDWRRLLNLRHILVRVVEVFFLLFLSINSQVVLENPTGFVLVSLLFATYIALVTRDPPVRFERILYNIESNISKITRLTTTSLFVFELLRGDHRVLLSPRIKWYMTINKAKSFASVLLALFMFRFANSLMLTQLPVYLSRSLNIRGNDILMIYAIARLHLLAIYVLTSGKRLSPTTLILARATTSILLVVFAAGLGDFAISLLLGLIIYLNGLVDVVLYTMYTELQGKARATAYMLVGEIAGFLGTVTSGLMYSIVGYEGIVYSTTLLIGISILPLL